MRKRLEDLPPENRLPPQEPYKNRWGAKPGPGYRQCEGVTLAGKRCLRGAEQGRSLCSVHWSQQEEIPF